ncbi:hypothetical protein HW555_012381 [Spodoptera exigua]|uniref:Uncharacterized protein n=1 Tax=Spodoptera exigua TaxID=7107 RepID=A0A835KZ42_SPOEX|nr:hypothetical protein HW555_012381 [Spodoptera exigua]
MGQALQEGMCLQAWVPETESWYTLYTDTGVCLIKTANSAFNKQACRSSDSERFITPMDNVFACQKG